MGKTVKRTLTPQKAVAILKGYDTIITLEEAEIMLDFLYDFVQLAIQVSVQGRPEEQWILDRMTTPVKT